MTEEVAVPSLGVGVYPKAQIINRFVAKFVDGLVAAAAGRLLHPVGWVAGLTYLLIADGFSGGRSIGKRLIGLQTVTPKRRETAGFRESIIRNLPLALAYLAFPIPYIGWLASAGILVFESLLIIGNDQGLRLGDELAHTQVLEMGELDLRT